MTYRRFALFPLLLACISNATGCIGFGCGGATQTMTPETIANGTATAVRTPSTCGVAPPFTAQDRFTLSVSGDKSPGEGVRVALTLSVLGSVPVARSIPLDVPLSAGTDGGGPDIAKSTDGTVTFSYLETETIDGGNVVGPQLSSAEVTISILPTAEQGWMNVSVDAVFVGGAHIAQEFEARAVTESVACPTGTH